MNLLLNRERGSAITVALIGAGVGIFSSLTSAWLTSEAKLSGLRSEIATVQGNVLVIEERQANHYRELSASFDEIKADVKVMRQELRDIFIELSSM